MRKKVNVHEVGPRDGFQSIKQFIPTSTKKRIIEKIIQAGLKDIQLTSFVSGKAIPQLADAKELAEYFIPLYPEITFRALVPNMFGAKAAADAGVKNVVLFLSASETHNKANVNRTIKESLKEISNITSAIPYLDVSLGIATAFSCPFEGTTPIGEVIKIVNEGVNMGIKSFELGDTVGTANPSQVKLYLEEMRNTFPDIRIGLHIHDTRNMGILSSWIAIENGADFVQASIGGLGGCPFAPGATGNVSTEDLIYVLNSSGFETGVDTEKIVNAAKFVKLEVEGNYSGHLINI